MAEDKKKRGTSSAQILLNWIKKIHSIVTETNKTISNIKGLDELIKKQKAIENKLNEIDEKLNQLITPQQIEQKEAEENKKNLPTTSKTISSNRNEKISKDTRQKLANIAKYISNLWEYFLPENPGKKEKEILKNKFRDPVVKAYKKVYKQLDKDEKVLWAKSSKDIDVQINSIITKELFHIFDNQFNDIVDSHQKSETELKQIRDSLMDKFGLIEMPIQVEKDIFDEDKHTELDSQRNVLNIDRAILSILKPGYIYRETGEILKKACVSVNYNF